MVSTAVLTAGDFSESAECTFPKETGGDFSDVVRGGERDCSLRGEMPTGVREGLVYDFRNGTYNKAVIPNRKGRSTGNWVGFCPAVF